MSARLARVLFARVTDTHFDSSAGHLHFLPRECNNMCTCTVCRVDTHCGSRSHSAHCCSTSCLCVCCRDEWNGAYPYICLLYSPRPSLGYGLSQPSRRADLLADGVDCTLLPVKAKGTISALYTITCQLCSYLQIGVQIALGLMFHFALVSDSNLRL